MDTSPGVGASRQLNAYWTSGPGLAKWSTNPKPYTTLLALLKQYMPEREAKGLAAEYYHRVFGKWPGRGH